MTKTGELYRWSKNNYEKERGNFGPKTYAQICELLLRLQANYLCPAMHDASMAFHRIPENRLVADSFAIVMGSSHCEPLLFNTASEWKRDKMGEWDYINNRAGVDSVLRARANECAPFENVYTLALRGLHDRAMNASNDMADRKQMLQECLRAQRKMLIDATGKRAKISRKPLLLIKRCWMYTTRDWNCRMMLRLYGRTTTMAI